jgi:hypothetical protein
MPRRKWEMEEQHLAASIEWAQMCPRSKSFLTGEGQHRDEAQQRRFTAEVVGQCNTAATAFTERMQSDFATYTGTWHTCPKIFNCILDPQIAPHFCHKVLSPPPLISSHDI